MQKMAGKQDFESDLTKSIEIIRKASGEKVLGFRAPFFSINKKYIWAFTVARKYLKYDSSIFPVALHYGLGRAPRYVYRMSENDPFMNDDKSNFTEVPLSTWNLRGMGNLPIAGGFYLRFIPFWIIRSGIKKLNERSHQAVMYIHPKDLDEKMPRIKQYRWHYYWGVKDTTKKLEYLLKNFRFTTMREILKI